MRTATRLQTANRDALVIDDDQPYDSGTYDAPPRPEQDDEESPEDTEE